MSLAPEYAILPYLHMALGRGWCVCVRSRERAQDSKCLKALRVLGMPWACAHMCICNDRITLLSLVGASHLSPSSTHCCYHTWGSQSYVRSGLAACLLSPIPRASLRVGSREGGFTQRSQTMRGTKMYVEIPQIHLWGSKVRLKSKQKAKAMYISPGKMGTALH